MSKHVLFVCSYNRLRSLTAENIFKNTPGLSVRSAGTSESARIRVNEKDLRWADIIFVMEKEHQKILSQRFPLVIKEKKVICLNIQDQYEYMDPDLVELLKMEVGHWLTTL